MFAAKISVSRFRIANTKRQGSSALTGADADEYRHFLIDLTLTFAFGEDVLAFARAVVGRGGGFLAFAFAFAAA